MVAGGVLNRAGPSSGMRCVQEVNSLDREYSNLVRRWLDNTLQSS
jgi:uncharacterized protein YggL (DUF469 family)